MSSGFSDAGNTIASASAEISVVTFRVNNPIVPTDSREVNVKRIATTFTRIRTTVHASRLTAYRSLRKRVNHDERLSVVVHGNWHVA